ncbi:MAG: methionine--tRNA ligase [Thermoplasmata archaeon]
MAKIFLGVAWPYASGPRHIGHAAGAYIPADIFARYHRMAGNEVLMVSGSDMHGTPTTVRADEEGVPPDVVAERYHALHTKNFDELGISFDLYWKTSASAHKAVVQDVFLRLMEKGHVYEDTMEASWCPTCEKFRPDRYIEGECPHCHFSRSRGDQCEECGRMLDPFDLIQPRCKVCGEPVERRETRHLFFRLSGFQKSIKDWLKTKGHWRPHVLHFTLAWLEEGLRDRPVTRDIDWGIEIPLEGYDSKRIYVWFEAVMGYLTASMEWARCRGEEDLWKSWWLDSDARHYYFVGKDNIVFHTIIWPAILMGYDEELGLPYDVPANQYMNFGGERMSTGRGVGVWLQDLLEAFEPDTLRYYVSAAMPENRDSEFSFEELERRTNTELVAVYGNLVHRVLTFTYKNFGKVPPTIDLAEEDESLLREMRERWRKAGQNLEYCHFKDALKEVMQLARRGNQYFDGKAPWDLIKENREACGTALHVSLRLVKALAILTAPFLPFSADRLWRMLGYEGSVHNVSWEEALEDVPTGQTLVPPRPLFRRIEAAGATVEEEAQRLDIRVGRVVKVENHPRADKLYLVEVDLGTERRRLVVGIRQEYKTSEIEGRSIVVLCNLKPATFRGIKSEGMLLAAVEGDVISILLAGNAAPGTQVLGSPEAPEISFEEFRKLKIRTDEEGRVHFYGTADGEGVPLRAGDEFIKVDRPVQSGSEVT